MANPRRIVLVHTGDQFPDYYSQRAISMVRRHLGPPHEIRVLTDRQRPLPTDVEQILTERTDLKGWWNKMLLFSPRVLGDQEIFYLDISLVIKDKLDPFLEFADQSASPLISTQDFKHGGLNSCLLRIRPGEISTLLWETFQKGEMEPGWSNGQQDYTSGVLKKYGYRDQVAYFPNELIVSYRKTRDLHRADPAEALRRVAAASIVKFHGRPRPHQVVSPTFFLRCLVSYPQHLFSDYRFLRRELRAWWR